MTRPTPPGAVVSEGHPGGADAPAARPGPIAVSPAIGPLPAIYVPAAPGQASPAGLLWLAVAHAAGWAARWAARRPPIGGHMSDNPADLRYSQDHLWARLDAGGRLVRSGVTDFAQQSLGDVVDVSPPRAGDARLLLGATATSTVARGRRGQIRVPWPTVAPGRASAGP